MTQLTSVDIELDMPLKVISFIEFLCRNGWNINDHGGIVYLPLNDDGMYGWTKKNTNQWDDVKNEISKKIALQEVIGIVLTNNDYSTGGEMLFWEGYCSLSFCITINVKKVSGAVDVHYYVSLLTKAMKDFGITAKKIDIENC